jgi:hypothetical protein
VLLLGPLYHLTGSPRWRRRGACCAPAAW